MIKSARFTTAFFAMIFISWAATAQDIPPKPIKTPTPRYDTYAGTMFIEGWVYLEFLITSEGNVQDIKVIASYPKGRFDDEAISTVKEWKYSPRLVDGVPTDQPGHRLAAKFAMDVDRGIGEADIANFQRATRSLAENDIPNAEKYVNKIRERFKAEKLNLTEIARYYQIEGVLANKKHEYVKAAEQIEYSLSLTNYLDNKKVVDYLHMQMIVAFAGLDQMHNVVDYYDAWRKASSAEVPTDLAASVENLRKDGFGRGRRFEITTYRGMADLENKSRKEEKPYNNKENSPPSLPATPQ